MHLLLIFHQKTIELLFDFCLKAILISGNPVVVEHLRTIEHSQCLQVRFTSIRFLIRVEKERPNRRETIFRSMSL